MHALTGLGEERVESIVTATDCFVRGHLAIGLDAMLKAVELPASVTFATRQRRNGGRKTTAKKMSNVSVDILPLNHVRNCKGPWKVE